MSNSYKLIFSYKAHDGPVRSICVVTSSSSSSSSSSSLSSYEIFSGSQENNSTVKRNIITTNRTSSLLSLSNTFVVNHEHWVTSLTSLSKRNNTIMITGCMNSQIRIYNCNDNDNELLHILKGHNGGIISFSWLKSNCNNNLLISGGWDGTARIWNIDDYTCIKIFSHHENGVHVLGLDNKIVTTSTGESYNNIPINWKIRIWSCDAETNDMLYEGNGEHKGSIRSIKHFNNNKFITTSNNGDAFIHEIINNDIKQIKKFHHPLEKDGLPTFVYDSTTLSSSKIVTCAEDGSVIIFSTDNNDDDNSNNEKGQLFYQNIQHPCCVWCVSSIPSSNSSDDCDFITGGNDGYIRIFSCDPMKTNTKVL